MKKAILISLCLYLSITATAGAYIPEVVCTCVPQYFKASTSSLLVQLKRSEKNGKPEYSVTLSQYVGAELDLKVLQEKLPVSLESLDNGFQIKVSAFRFELISIDLTQRVAFPEMNGYTSSGVYTLLPNEITRTKLEWKIGTKLMEYLTAFPAKFRYVNDDWSVNESTWCFTSDIKKLLSDTKN